MGHYKHYAKSRLNCEDIRIYGIYTSYSNTFKNEMIIPEFRSKFKHNNDYCNLDYYYINTTLKASYSVMNGIMQYIPGIYLIDSEYIEPSVVPYYLSLTRKSDWNVLISRDIYDLQYVSKPKWTVVSPKGENSTIISGNNLWDYIKKKEKINYEEAIHFPIEFYPYVLAMLGDTYRSIPRLRKIGWKTAFKFMKQVEEDWKRFDSITVIEKLVELLQNKKGVENSEFYDNYHCIDIEKQQNRMIDLDRLVIDAQLVDRYDIGALNSANQQIFLRFPLRLEFLL